MYIQRTCNLCGNKYDAYYHEFGESGMFTPVYNSDSIAIKQRFERTLKIIHYDVCPDCMNKIMKFINCELKRGDINDKT